MFIWTNEAWFASPGLTLAHQGFLGTTILASKGTWMDGIEQHTYWMPPVHLLIQAAWYKLFGFGLMALRSVSILSGVVALLAWYSAFSTLAANRGLALVATGIIATDYHFLMYAALGRPDMLCAALGSTAIALYLHYRTRSLRKALLLAHGFAAASCLTHPCGVLYASALVLLMLYYDRQHTGWRSIGLVATPYLAALASWGLYILQAPSQFVHQFTGNISGIASEFTDVTRGFLMASPLRALKWEYFRRYGGNFGWYSTGFVDRLPLYVLAVYTLAVACCLLVKQLRNHRGCRALLLVGSFEYLFMALFDGLKGSAYLVHTLPLCAAFLAFCIWFWAAKSRRAIWSLAPVLAFFVVVQIGTLIHDMISSTERWDYQSAVNFIRQARIPPQIIAGGEFAFEFGFESGMVDDPRLGYYTGQRPEFIAANPIDRGWVERSAVLYPEIHAYQVNLLANEYRVIFRNSHYTIYQRLHPQLH
ncbi:MAG TPA: glycosyltransferase family 39 protein [Bryobacteraceae bacterium]|nr:glycosyltransferase family 39 protein [Bryobacteraceae bacterium]